MNDNKPRVLNYKHLLPDETGVNIMRPSKWGNPFMIGRDGDRDRVCDLFEDYVENNPEFKAQIKKELKGQNLVCCCKEKKKNVRCHGDTLLRVANEVSEDDF